jgi:hypothetical protein
VAAPRTAIFQSFGATNDGRETSLGFGVTDIFSTRDELHAGTRPVTITATRANRTFHGASWPRKSPLRWRRAAAKRGG